MLTQNSKSILYIENPKLAKPWIYFLATYIWTWFFFGIAYCIGVSAESGQAIGVILVLLALSGPSVMGITFAHLTLNKAGQKDFWNRALNFKIISFKFYFIIILFLPTICIIARMLDNSWNSFSFTRLLPSLSLTLLTMPLVPVLEEIGWHGYVFDRLQEKYSALAATLIFGFLWGVWHTPAFFLQKSAFNIVSYGPYVFHAVIISIYFTWIYNNTGRSIISVILFHIVLEFCMNTNLIPLDGYGSFYYLTLLIIIAVTILYIYGGKTLTISNKG